jgi:hypothetical protein
MSVNLGGKRGRDTIGYTTLPVVSKPERLMINESELTSSETSAILLGSKMLLKGEGQGDFFMVANKEAGWTQNHWRKYVDRYPEYAEEAKLAVDRIGKPFTV